MKNCSVCTRSFENEDEKITTCGTPCAHALELLETGADLAWKTQPSEDPRIFFYKLSFGRIIDEWSILCLKRSHTKSIRNQQEIDYCIFQVNRCIETNLNQIIHNDAQRNSLIDLMRDLFKVNAMIWQERDLANNHRVSDDEKLRALVRAASYSQMRDGFIRSIDTLVTGKTIHFRVFNGQDT